MAEDDINPNADDFDGEDEEDNEASSAEAQRILDELSQFGDGDAPLDDPEDQPDRAFGEDDDNPEPALSQSMSTIHTGSQLTDQEITDGLPPTGQVINPEGAMNALEEDPDAEPEFINPNAEEPQYDRSPDEPTDFGFEPAPEQPAEEPVVEEQAAPEQPPEDPTGEGAPEEFIQTVEPPAAAGPTTPTTPTTPTAPTVPTTPSTPTTPVDVNDPPVAVDDAMSGVEDTPITFTAQDLLGNDSDPDGDTLSITSFEQPENGTITDNGDVTYTFTPNADWNGETDFNYTITDGNGGTSTATVTIDVDGVNDPPVAADDSFSGSEDTPITFTAAELLGNDTDPDGDTLSITSFEQPENGTITDNGDGTYTFTPNANWNGETDFNYTITDGNGGTSTATVTIDVDGINDPPVAADDTFQSVNGEPVTFTAQDILGNDSDPEGDQLTITGFEQPEDGTITDNGDGTYTFTPNENWDGQSNFNYTITDGNGGTSTATVKISTDGINEPPVALDDSATTNEDTPVTLNLLENDSDLDGDTLTITQIDGQDVAVGDTVDVGYGTVTLNENGTVTFNPDENWNGTESFEYTISDGTDTATATATIDIDAVNDPPVAVDDSATTNEDTPVTLNLLENDSDLDGDTLTVTQIDGQNVNPGDTVDVGYGTVTLNEDGSATFTPDQNWNGTETFEYTISDGTETATATATIDIDAVNDPPVANDDSFSGEEDSPITFTAQDLLGNDTDADGDTLTITSFEQPDNGTITDNGDGTFTFTPDADWNGQTDFNYTITDGNGGTSTATVTIDVEGVAEPTELADDPTLETGSVTGAEDTAVPLDIAASLTDLDGSETLSLTISNVPSGSSLNFGTDNGDGTWTISADDFASNPDLLDNLTITPPQDYYGDFSLEVSATATETDGGDEATVTSTFGVTVTPVVDAPTLETENVVGTEDNDVELQIQAFMDPSTTETVDTLILSGIPEGAVLNKGTDNGDGTWSLSAGEVSGLIMTPPHDYEGTFTIQVTAISTDGGVDVSNFQVEIEGALDVTNAVGNEDETISLNIDPGEAGVVTISGVPDGATLIGATDNGDGTYTVTDFQNLAIVPPENSDEDFTLSVRADDDETVELFVQVDAEADTPILDLGALAEGSEDGAIALDISAAVTDTDGSESLSITITGVPDGAVLSAGTDNGDGTWTISAEDLSNNPTLLDNLTITPPEDFSGTFDLGVTATSTEANGGDTAETSGTITVDVAAVADAADLTTQDAAGTEDTAIALNITAASTDADGSESVSVTISNIPDGAVLTDGSGNEITITDGSAELTPDQLTGLTITPPENSDEDFTLNVAVTTTDGDDSTTVTGSLNVDVAADADAPTLDLTATATGDEDTAIALDIDVSSVDDISSIVITDVPDGAVLSAGTDNGDGTWTLEEGDLEGLTITIDDLPDGAVLSAGTQNEDGSWTVDAGDIEGLSVKLPGDAQDFNVSVTATSVENDGDTATTTTTFSVTVPEIDNVAEGATITENDAAGFEDTAIELNIDIDMTDSDGSETLAVTISDIPDGAVLRDGDGNEIEISDGSAEVTQDQLEGLTITPPENSNEDFDLTITATTTETSTGDTSTSTATLSVDVTGIADEPTISVELGEGTVSGGNPSPVAYWNMDETSGLTMNDQIGDHDGHSVGESLSKNDLDMDDASNIHQSGAHSGVSAELNTAAEFKDNDGQYIEVPHSADLKPASGTMTLWFNSDESNDGTLASSDSSGYDDGGHFNLSINSSGQLELRMQDTNSSHTISGGSVSAGEWNQVTVSWGEGGMKIFQNGELVASDPSYTGGLQGNENPWTFGASQSYSGDNVASNMGDFFDGHIDDIAIYDTPLTDEQIQDLYELGVEDLMNTGSGDEIITYPINISTNLTDTDGSESISVTLSDLPDGAVLLDADGNEILGTDGEFLLTGDQIDGLQISVPADTGDFAFTTTATATEDDGSTNTVTTIAGIDDSSSDTSFEQLDDGGDTWDNDASSLSEDVILGGDGDDDIYTGGGDDTIDGGDGNDYISGEDGDDVMYGGAGDDTLVGGDGNDIMEGGAGDDEAYGGQGDDLFIFGAGDGADYFDGGNGWSDTIQLDGVDGGPGGDSGWTMSLDDGVTYTETDDGIVFDSEASGKIELADGSELTFEGVEKLEW